MDHHSFDGSFKIYVDPPRMDAPAVEAEPGNDPYGATDSFSGEVENVKDNVRSMEKLYARLNDINEEIKAAQSAKAMKDLRCKLNADLDFLLKLAKQINKKFDGLVMANAAQRRLTGSGPGSSADQARAAMISEQAETLNHMMRNFQGLRVRMETEHRQLIESRYFAITREKATAEAIDNLIASEVPESPLHHAMQEHGRGAVAEVVAEIQERRDAMMEIRRNLMCLHQIFLGISRPVDAKSGGIVNRGGGAGVGGAAPPSPVEMYAPAMVGHGAPVKSGTGGLNDYEKETRKQAYIAIALAVVIIIAIIISLLNIENKLENEAN